MYVGHSGNLENKQEVQRRSDIPENLFRRKPALFLAKLGIAIAIYSGGVSLWWRSEMAILQIGAIIVIAGMIAMLVEYQHELLHHHAFESQRLNRLFGILCGLPFFSSFSGYRAKHLRHHRDLGTPQNREFFDYQHHSITTILGFLRCGFSLHRWIKIAREMRLALFNESSEDAINAREQQEVRHDYLLMLFVLACAIALSIFARSTILIFIWVFPMVLAEFFHFLIETPEHYGLNTQTEGNVLVNTRTINGSWFSLWLSNGNNLHTAHHYHPGVPMCRVPQLHRLLAARMRPECVEKTYWSFYRKVLQGKYHLS